MILNRWFQASILALALPGCITRQELREQHCAQLAIERHGWYPPEGAYGTWTHGERCYTRLWSRRKIYEGKIK